MPLFNEKLWDYIQHGSISEHQQGGHIEVPITCYKPGDHNRTQSLLLLSQRLCRIDCNIFRLWAGYKHRVDERI
jgi:hypothetical protein